MTINYSKFAYALKNLLSKEANIITEDIIRYHFIMLHNKRPQIEVPYIRNNTNTPPLKIKPQYLKHLKKTKSRVDLFYEKFNTAIEFKFHRKTNYSNNCTTTKIGQAFSDLNRLSLLDCDEKYFIYVFDRDMKVYFDNNNTGNNVPHFYFTRKNAPQQFCIDSSNLGNYKKGEFLKNAFAGFTKTIFSYNTFNIDIKLEYYDEIIRDMYYLIIYKVN